MATSDKLKTLAIKVETFDKLKKAKEEYVKKHNNITISTAGFATFLIETALKQV